MKIIIAACAALLLSACSSSKSDVTLVAATNALRPPIEGVYPDCNFGVVPPDAGGPAACAKPAQ